MPPASRRTFLSSLAGGALTAASPARKLNFVFILIDDMGWRDLGCFGSTFYETPNIDRLAQRGCRFTDFYVTSPVCSPTRAALLTGRDPNRYNMRHIVNNGFADRNVKWPKYHHVPLAEPTIPRQLKKAGYRTAHIGKWHISLFNFPGEPGPFEYGYDHYLLNAGPNQYRVVNPQEFVRNGERLTECPLWTDELYVNEAIRFIDDNTNHPFILHLCSHTPHTPEECADRFKQMYGELTDEEQTYYGCITQLDENLGRLFDFMESRDLLENTIVVFASDNGPIHPIFGAERHRRNGWANRGSAGPFSAGKLVIYDGGIRVPAIVSWPGVSKPGCVSSTPTSILDFFPTFCNATGVSLPKDLPFDGGDLCPALEGKEIERPHSLYWQFDSAENKNIRYRDGYYWSPSLAIRQGRWKLLSKEGFIDPELYNLENDPGERWNLAEHHPDITERLLADLRQLHTEINRPTYGKSDYLNEAILKDDSLRSELNEKRGDE